MWAPVTPVIAITFFERRYNNHPQLLQYAHRVLEQHPVELTFFFVPQVVQALRYDDLGGFQHDPFADCPDSLTRIRRPVYIRDREDLPAVLPPDHLEHEGELLPR